MSEIVLGSGSAIRAQVLRGAGVAFSVEKPQVDEAELKAGWIDRSPAEVAVGLAEAKAAEVSARFPEALVIGADQTLELAGRLYDKAESPEAARARLLELRGREHRLNAGTALARGGEIVWSDLQVSRMKVRAFSDEWLDHYMSQVGGALTASVGAYEYEGLGVQLFEKVQGDFYAVLGLPLVPLLEALREQGAVPR